MLCGSLSPAQVAAAEEAQALQGTMPDVFKEFSF